MLPAIPPAVWWALTALGGTAAVKGLFDQFALEPRRLKLMEQQLRGQLESQKAQTTGQKQAYEANTRATQDYLKTLMTLRQDEMLRAAEERREVRARESRDRQMDLLMTMLNTTMNQPQARPAYDPPPMSLMGLIRG